MTQLNRGLKCENDINVFMKKAFPGIDFLYEDGILYVEKDHRNKVAYDYCWGHYVSPPLGGIKSME